jgi:hypothetical protein
MRTIVLPGNGVTLGIEVHHCTTTEGGFPVRGTLVQIGIPDDLDRPKEFQTVLEEVRLSCKSPDVFSRAEGSKRAARHLNRILRTKYKEMFSRNDRREIFEAVYPGFSKPRQTLEQRLRHRVALLEQFVTKLGYTVDAQGRVVEPVRDISHDARLMKIGEPSPMPGHAD